MNILLNILLYIAAYGAFIALALSVLALIGFCLWRALKWLGKIVRAITPED